MIVGDRLSAINARALVQSEHGGCRLVPRVLSDGRFAVPAAVLTDTGFAAAAATLSGWSTETPSSGDYVALPEGSTGESPFGLLVDGKTLVHSGMRGSSLTMPDTDVFKFEIVVNDWSWLGDSSNGNRRSEIQTMPGSGYGATTVWSSFCLVYGNTVGMDSADFAIVHQWHGVDSQFTRSPVCAINAEYGVLKWVTRSSADSSEHVHYSMTRPAKGARTYIVMQITFGSSGHLNAWVNGSQVVDVDYPIGYYNDLTDGSGRTELAYPLWGLYTRNRGETQVACHANIEWGTSDLSARIAAPLSVPEFVIDTDNDLFPYTLPFTLAS